MTVKLPKPNKSQKWASDIGKQINKSEPQKPLDKILGLIPSRGNGKTPIENAAYPKKKSKKK